MHSYYRNLTSGGVKRWLGLGFGMGLGFELARELLPVVGFLVLLGLLTRPTLTLALVGATIAGSVLWHNRHMLRESQEARRKREARARWSGGAR